MVRRLLLAFVVVQLADLYGLVWIGRNLGFWTTFGLTAAMGLLGTALARREGLRVWRSWQSALERGQAPEESMVAGALVLLGAVLLVAPGFGTDVLGLLLLLPVTRRPLAKLGSRWLRREHQQPPVTPSRSQVEARAWSPFAGAPRGADVIDTIGVESPNDAIEPPRTDRVLGK